MDAPQSVEVDVLFQLPPSESSCCVPNVSSQSSKLGKYTFRMETYKTSRRSGIKQGLDSDVVSGPSCVVFTPHKLFATEYLGTAFTNHAKLDDLAPRI